jgi:uncharacterized protein
MDLTNEFSVGLPLDRAWAVLTDVERIAPCMPGAQLTGVEGDDYQGQVLVKLGPVTAQYNGTATFERKDDVEHVAVLRASGRDSRGQGNATAVISAALRPDGTRTNVVVHTDLTITGKIAQFGRGVILDVSAKLLGQFVECLESSLAHETQTRTAASAVTLKDADSSETGVETPSPPTAVYGPPFAPEPAGEPLDLAAIARGPILKRVVPIALACVIVAVVVVRVGRR